MTPPTITTKRCYCCGQDLPLAMFYKDRTKKDGLRSQCRECDKAYRKTEAGRAYQRRFDLKRKYGVSPEQFDQMLEAQGHKCAICGTKEPGGQGTWHVDHDHDTGAVRGLLCSNCNRGLGHFKDNRSLLYAAGRYLKNHGRTDRVQRASQGAGVPAHPAQHRKG